MTTQTKPVTESEAFSIMLALESHLDTLDDESLTDEQMAGIAVKFIMDRVGNIAKEEQ